MQKGHRIEAVTRASHTAAILVSAMIVAAPVAQAETPAADGLNSLRRSPTYREAVVAGAKRSGEWMVHPCDRANFTFGDRLGQVAAPSFNDRGQATSGAWIEHVSADGCGGRRQLNVLVVVRGPGQIATVPLLPGTSRADPVLQKDGAAYAFVAAGVDSKGCKPIFVADTAFLDFSKEPSGVPGKPAWSERWTVVQCDRRVPVVLRFVPDKRGTAVVIDHVMPKPAQ